MSSVIIVSLKYFWCHHLKSFCCNIIKRLLRLNKEYTVDFKCDITVSVWTKGLIQYVQTPLGLHGFLQRWMQFGGDRGQATVPRITTKVRPRFGLWWSQTFCCGWCGNGHVQLASSGYLFLASRWADVSRNRGLGCPLTFQGLMAADFVHPPEVSQSCNSLWLSWGPIALALQAQTQADPPPQQILQELSIVCTSWQLWRLQGQACLAWFVVAAVWPAANTHQESSM